MCSAAGLAHLEQLIHLETLELGIRGHRDFPIADWTKPNFSTPLLLKIWAGIDANRVRAGLDPSPARAALLKAEAARRKASALKLRSQARALQRQARLLTDRAEALLAQAATLDN